MRWPSRHFLTGRIGFLSIYEIVSETLAKMPAREPRTVGEILEIDRESRALARQFVAARPQRHRPDSVSA